MKKLTLSSLLENKACTEHTKLFTETFGTEMLCDELHCIEAVKVGLAIDWYVVHVSSPEQRKEYRKRVLPIKATYQSKLQELHKIQDNTAIAELTQQYKIDKVLLLKEINDSVL
jgi:hypothetical protein